jgi:hypothetical protein
MILGLLLPGVKIKKVNTIRRCSTHRNIRNAHNILVGKYDGNSPLGDRDVNERTILKGILGGYL